MRSVISFLTLLALMHGCTSAVQSPETPAPTATPEQSQGESLSCALPSGMSPTERWIEVSLREQVVRLCEGDGVRGEYLAATGAGDEPETRTFSGLFEVYEKSDGPLYLWQYDVYISDWVGFDLEHENGFHSLPMDESGRVLDSRLGLPVSHGCVRTAQSVAVFEWATIGMTVWVH